MKKLFKIVLILAGLGIIAAALVWKFYVNKPHDDIEKQTPAYSLAANEIWAKYTTNATTADSLYNGQVIEITGILNRADKSDSLVYAIFVMEADSMFGDKSVRCEMLPKYNEETTSLPEGKEIKIKGYCTGFDQTDIKFNKCSLVK